MYTFVNLRCCNEARTRMFEGTRAESFVRWVRVRTSNGAVTDYYLCVRCCLCAECSTRVGVAKK